MDFTILTYSKLLNTLKEQVFLFLSFEEFVSNPASGAIVLRHDVDLFPRNSLKFAEIEAGRGIKGTYYFRIVSESFDEKIIKEISSMGHEIGYHYEDVSLAAKRQKTKGKRQKWENSGSGQRAQSSEQEEELAKIAIESFAENLERLREIVPVKTICMHGSPMSRWDSRLLWKYYNYRDFGIIGEPYFDVNFDEVLYLTDTGRRWNGESVSVRDKPGRYDDLERKRRRDEETKARRDLSLSLSVPQSLSLSSQRFHSTFDIIKAAEEGKLPDKIMMTFHPQRWTDKLGPWVRELVWQNVKNAVKYFIVKSEK